MSKHNNDSCITKRVTLTKPKDNEQPRMEAAAADLPPAAPVPARPMLDRKAPHATHNERVKDVAILAGVKRQLRTLLLQGWVRKHGGSNTVE